MKRTFSGTTHVQHLLVSSHFECLLSAFLCLCLSFQLWFNIVLHFVYSLTEAIYPCEVNNMKLSCTLPFVMIQLCRLMFVLVAVGTIAAVAFFALNKCNSSKSMSSDLIYLSWPVHWFTASAKRSLTMHSVFYSIDTAQPSRHFRNDIQMNENSVCLIFSLRVYMCFFIFFCCSLKLF